MKYNKGELKETRNFRNLPKAYVPYYVEFAKKYNLTCTQTLLYGIIWQYSKLEHKAYTGSIQTLQVALNVARATVKKDLKTLISGGFVTKLIDKNGRYVYNCALKPQKNEIFIPITLRFAVVHNLTPHQMVIYTIIVRAMKQARKAYTGSVTTLSNILNCSRGTVINVLESLIRRGFIIKYKDLSANVTFVDGLSHKPGKTQKELEFNALWVKENGLFRGKIGRSARKKSSGLTKI